MHALAAFEGRIRVPWGPVSLKLSYIWTTWLHPGAEGLLVETCTTKTVYISLTGRLIQVRGSREKHWRVPPSVLSCSIAGLHVYLFQEINFIQCCFSVVASWFHYLQSHVAIPSGVQRYQLHHTHNSHTDIVLDTDTMPILNGIEEPTRVNKWWVMVTLSSKTVQECVLT